MSSVWGRQGGGRCRNSKTAVLPLGLPADMAPRPEPRHQREPKPPYRAWANFDPYADNVGCSIRVARRPSSLVAPPKAMALITADWPKELPKTRQVSSASSLKPGAKVSATTSAIDRSGNSGKTAVAPASALNPNRPGRQHEQRLPQVPPLDAAAPPTSPPHPTEASAEWAPALPPEPAQLRAASTPSSASRKRPNTGQLADDAVAGLPNPHPWLSAPPMSPSQGGVPLLPSSPHAAVVPPQAVEPGSPGGGAAIDSAYGLSPELSGTYGQLLGPRSVPRSVPLGTSWASMGGWEGAESTPVDGAAAAVSGAIDAAHAPDTATAASAVLFAMSEGASPAAASAARAAAACAAVAAWPADDVSFLPPVACAASPPAIDAQAPSGSGSGAAAAASAAACAAAAAANESLAAIASAADRVRNAAGSESLAQLEELDMMLQQHQDQLHARVESLREKKRQEHAEWVEGIQSILPGGVEETRGDAASADGAAAAAHSPSRSRYEAGVKIKLSPSARGRAGVDVQMTPAWLMADAAAAYKEDGGDDDTKGDGGAGRAEAAHGRLGGPRSLPGEEEMLARTRSATEGGTVAVPPPPLLEAAASPSRPSKPTACFSPKLAEAAAALAAGDDGAAAGVGASQRSSLESLTELEALLEEQHKQLIERGFIPPDAHWKAKVALADVRN